MKPITIEDTMELIRLVEQATGKHTKYILSRMEQSGSVSPTQRKAVLDGINNYKRYIYKILGINIED